MIVSIDFEDILHPFGVTDNGKANKKATIKFLRYEIALVNTFRVMLLMVSNRYIEECTQAAEKQLKELYV